ncbi:NAD-dependent epimerase/dehydratase family protein [Nocardioides dongxiaopingii]|uniref:NAD-dependent epimerase/dehydratase family protein n=1 Tax=Nocardioides dongxiaopingii TaxID=2576036 RepID=UPI0010C76BA6|nr:NAD-dependent epimerase/dehydratase family protein [Nocardioides dongxiaopingii]
MRIVITGATGNVGTAVVRRLAAEHDLVGVVRRPPDPPSGAEEPLDAVRWVTADLASDTSVPVLREAFAGADAVVHLVWAFQPSHRLDQLEQTGPGGTDRVLTAVRAAGVRHLVHMSSVGAYSPRTSDVPVTEDHPTGGIPGSPYSQHKAAAERLLDTFERTTTDHVVTRLRPGIVGQRGAGSALLRYGLPALAPAGLVRLVPLLPVDRGLELPMVHADDVAEAIARVLDARAPGPFNLAAAPVITVEHLAAALGARHVHVPLGVVRAAVAASWHARVQPLDPGWIDLAGSVPLMDCSRAEQELGWVPATDAVSTLQQVVDGMGERAHLPTPALRPRTLVDSARRFLGEGPVSRRDRP